MSSSVSAAVGGVARREPQPTGAKRANYTALNLQPYKSSAVGGASTKHYGKSSGHGMQSLGKVATSRRMPTPASLPSLRSEHAGNDPNVNLVPSGGGGWKSSSDDKENRVENPPETDKRSPEPQPVQVADKAPPTSPGKQFKAEFPSLEEQDKMTKKELEELQRRQREAIEATGEPGGGERRPPDLQGGSMGAGSSRPAAGERSWRDREILPHGGGMQHGPPPPPPPHHQGGRGAPFSHHHHHGGPQYPPHPYPPHYMMHHPPPRHGMRPPYPPMHGPPPPGGSGNRFPHGPPPVAYRPRYPPHYNPYELPPPSDPYAMPGLEEDVPRPPTVKADDLKSMELVDDDDEGWAGHHEEVDYTKEVVFSDSSDDEATPKEAKMKEAMSTKPERGRTDVSTAKPEKQDEPETTTSTNNKLTPPMSLPMSLLDQEQEGQPPQALHSEPPRMRQRDLEKERAKKPDQRHNMAYPPYPYPSYPHPYYSGYPSVPPGHGHFPMHHGGPPPPHAGYPPQPPQPTRGYGGPPHPHPGRGTKRSHAERDEGGYGGRHDYHGHWGGGGSYEEHYRPKRKWSNEDMERIEDRPRILTKHEDKRGSGRVSPEKKPESPEVAERASTSSFQRTLSSSSDPSATSEAPRHRVTFADDVTEVVADRDAGNVPPVQGSSRRALTQKIMLRKMGEKEGETSGERGNEVGQGASGAGRQTRSGEGDATVAESAKPKMAWSTNERGPIVSPKTLYEPEGKQSAAKFKKYQAQTREMQGNRGSHDLPTPTSEGGSTPTGERPDKARQEEVSSPVDRAEQSSPSGRERRPLPELRKGGRRQDKGEKTPHQDRESHDHHNRPHHRKENSKRERMGESEHMAEGSRTSRPERLSSTEEDFARDEHDYRDFCSKGPQRREQPEETRPPLLGIAPPRRDGHNGQRQDGRPPHRRKGERDRSQRERANQHDQRAPGEPEVSGNFDSHRVAAKPETECHRDAHLQGSDSGSNLEQRTEVGTLQRDRERLQREEEPWQHSRGERYLPSEHGHPSAADRGHPPSSERGHPQTERGDRGPPPTNRGHTPTEKGRGGPRRGGGDKDYHGGRGPPPPGDRQERGGGKDRDRGGKEGPPRERKSSDSHDAGNEKTGGRGGSGRRAPASSRDSAPESSRPPRSRGPPLLPNPPTPPLYPPADSVLPTPNHHETRGHQEPPKPQAQSARKLSQDREVKGEHHEVKSPADLGYGELEDIESGEDWDNEPVNISSGARLGAKGSKGPYTETERGHGHRKGGGEQMTKGGRPARFSREESRAHHGQRGNREDRPPREDRRQRDEGDGGGRRDGRRGGKGGREETAPRHAGQRKSQPHQERKLEEGGGDIQGVARQRSKTPQGGGSGAVKDGKLDAIPSSASVNHPPKTDFTKYDLNSHKVAIVDDINRGQGLEEGRISPSAHGEFVEVTSKKSQKERHRKEKEEQKRQEEERRRDENKKKRKQGQPRGGSAGASSSSLDREKTQQHQFTSSSNKPFSAWMMEVTATSGSSHIVRDEELWDTDETIQSHLPVVIAAPGSQLKHQPAPGVQPLQPQLQATPLQQPSPSPHMWPVEAPKPGVPHTAELVTSDYSLFGGSSGLLSHAVDSTLPISSNMATPASAPLSGQSSASGVGGVGGGGQDSTTIGTRKSDSWQAQSQTTKLNEQELPRDDSEEAKSVQKTEKGSRGRGVHGSGPSKNLPPRLKSQQDPSGPGRGRGGRSAGRGSGGERRGPGRERGIHESIEEKKASAVTSEPVSDKDKGGRLQGGKPAAQIYVHPRARSSGETQPAGQKPLPSGAASVSKPEGGGGGGTRGSERPHPQQTHPPSSKDKDHRSFQQQSKVTMATAMAMGNKPQGQPTRATTTSTTTDPSSQVTIITVVTSQPMRAGRSQAAVTSGSGVGATGGRAGAAMKEVGRDGRRSEQDGNIAVGAGRMTASSTAVSGSASDVGSMEQKDVRSTTPAQAPQQRSGSTQQEKPFSYAQALKTKSSSYSKLPEGTSCRTPSSKLSSRSQTPSESSLLGGGGGGGGKGITFGSGGTSGSPVLGYKQDKGAGLLHSPHEDPLDLEFRSGSALSVATASDSITSERSASRQSINLPLDSAPQVDDTQETGRIKSGDSETEEVYDTDAETKVATVVEPKVQYDPSGLSDSLSRLPSSPLFPVPPTEHGRPGSPPPLRSSPTTPLTKVYSSSPARSEFVDHPAIPVAHTSPSATPTKPPQHVMCEQEGTFGICGDGGQQSPSPLPLSVSSQSEEVYHNQGAQVALLTGGETRPTAGAQVFETTQHLEQAPPTARLRESDEVGDAEKTTSAAPEVNVLTSADLKPTEVKGGGHGLTLPLPVRSRESVFPSPPVPTMSSILPHPPGVQMGFAAQQGQSHLPLRPPGPPRHPGLLPGQRMPQLTQQQLLLFSLQQQAMHARLAAAALNKFQPQQHSGQPYLQVHHHVQQAQAHTHAQQQQHAVATAASLTQQQQQQQQQRFEKNSPPNAVIVSQPSLVDALQYQAAMAAVVAQQQQGLVSRHPGKVAAPLYGNEGAPPLPLPHAHLQPQHQQLHNFQQQYGKAQALLHPTQQPAQRPAMMQQAHATATVQPPHPQAMEHGSGNQPHTQQQQQQQMERQQQREMGSDASGKSGLSISAIPFIPNSQSLSGNTPPATRKFTASAPNGLPGEGIPPPQPVSAVPVAAGHMTHPSAPLLQHVVLPHPHVVATPPPGGMLPIPRPHPQQMHVGNPAAQFQHPVQRKTSASSAPPPQGQSLLGGPAYQVIDKSHHPTGALPRQLSNEGPGGAAKPPPGLSLPLRSNVLGEQGTTPTPPGLVMAAGLDLQSRTMAMNRALVNTAPVTVAAGYAVRPQHTHPHPMTELPSLYGPPPKLQPNGGNKRALLPTPPATGPIPTPLGYLAGGAHHHIATATPNVTVPPGWPGGSVRIPPHRVHPPVTNPSSHRHPVMYTQEQQQQPVIQRSNYTGGAGYSRGNGSGM